jgi:hypothetical protein
VRASRESRESRLLTLRDLLCPEQRQEILGFSAVLVGHPHLTEIVLRKLARQALESH